MTEKSIINEVISLDEMILNGEEEEEGREYIYDCRCGGIFTVSVENARELSKEELIVSCDTCSLCVQVIHNN